MGLKDSMGREHSYLRIALTDRCNLRCRYCMPEAGINFAPKEEILSYEEILKIATIFVQLGINKIRLTGGEPLARKDISQLLLPLGQICDNIHITTNATLLHQNFDLLTESGIRSLNISLDTLDCEKFFEITRRDQFDIVLQNILRCKDYQIPAKINMVVMKGINDHEIIPFIKFGEMHNLHIRFIEAMPFNEWDGNKNLYISAPEILDRITTYYEHSKRIPMQTPSSSIQYQFASGYTYSIIPAYSRSLCNSCNRIRLTPKGELLNCLYSEKGISLRDMLRDKSFTKEKLINEIRKSLLHKKWSGKEEENMDNIALRSMSSIGG